MFVTALVKFTTISKPTEGPDYMSQEDLISLKSSTVEEQLGSLEAKFNAILDSVMPPTSGSQPNAQATCSATGECSSKQQVSLPPHPNPQQVATRPRAPCLSLHSSSRFQVYPPPGHSPFSSGHSRFPVCPTLGFLPLSSNRPSSNRPQV